MPTAGVQANITVKVKIVVAVEITVGKFGWVYDSTTEQARSRFLRHRHEPTRVSYSEVPIRWQ